MYIKRKNIKKYEKIFCRNNKNIYLCARKVRGLPRVSLNYGVMAAQQILVLLV